jgi:uncharacterized protein YceK
MKRILLLTVVMVSGCSTGFKGPDRIESYGKPYVAYTRQGSIPVDTVYRDVWPISPVVTITNNPVPKAFALPVIGSILSGASSVYNVFRGGNGKCYTYREDFVIMGTNFTPEQIEGMLDKVIIKHSDAQRDGWLPDRRNQ